MLTIDGPRPFPTGGYPFPNIPTVDDMLSGAAWKDTTSCSIGGTGPYIPKMLLGRSDSEEERETRRQFYRQWKRDLQVRNLLGVVEAMRGEGMIDESVAVELEGKVHDEDGFCPFRLELMIAFVRQVIKILAPT
jgi:hypothetical protein